MDIPKRCHFCSNPAVAHLFYREITFFGSKYGYAFLCDRHRVEEELGRWEG